MKRKLKIAGVVVLGVSALGILGAGVLIRSAAKGRTYSEVSLVPHRRVGLVLGCSRRLPDGRRNLFFAYRIAAAAGLFSAGKVDYLLVSGDNHVAGYDEPSDMKQALVAAGVPPGRVFCDYAGFRTLDSIVRAREVFGETSVTVISQQFHNRRAIYIARSRGMDALGFNARDVDSHHSLRTRVRELLARVKTVLDVCVWGARPRFGGPPIMIGESARQPPAAVARTAPPEA